MKIKLYVSLSCTGMASQSRKRSVNHSAHRVLLEYILREPLTYLEPASHKKNPKLNELI